VKYLVIGILCRSEVIVSLFVWRQRGRRRRMQNWLQICSFMALLTSSCPLDIINYSNPLWLSRELWRSRIFCDQSIREGKVCEWWCCEPRIVTRTV